jgi:hypothetical protein
VRAQQKDAPMADYTEDELAPDTPLDDLRGRRIFIWRGQPEADNKRLADAIAEVAAAELFIQDKTVAQFVDGKLIRALKDDLRRIIAKHFVSIRLVRRADGGFDREIYPFDFPDTPDASKGPTLRCLLDVMALLVERLATAPSEPVRLSEQQQFEVRMRARSGEPLARIATAYGIDIDTIKTMGRS